MLRRFRIFAISLFLFSNCNIPDSETMRVVVVGDVLLDRGLRKIVDSQGPEFPFRDVESEFKKSDFVIVNLEGPITDSVTPVMKKYIFRFDSNCAKALKNVGVTHCALANNHVVDQGFSGVRNTIKNLEAADLQYVGVGYNRQERLEPSILTKGELNVAVFNACPLRIENWIVTDSVLNICDSDISELSRAVSDFKEKHKEFYVLVVLHWGFEFRTEPTFQQKLDARRLIKSGADVVVGHHPHVVQPSEIVDNKLVAYSLGNFVFDQRNPLGRKAQMLRLDFSKDTISYRLIDVDIVKNCPRIR